MVALIKIVVQLLADVARFIYLQFWPTRVLEAENLFLRRQLALFKERGVNPRRVDAATRISLAVLSGLFDWRNALVFVQPKTIIGWQRAGWRLFWRWKFRPGRPRIPVQLRALIRRMALENPIWGEERIANELWVKLNIRVSPRTVRKYMPNLPAGQPRGDQRWSTFLKNHGLISHGRAVNRRDVNNCGRQTRERERRMRKFKSPNHAQQFLSIFGMIQDLFSVGRHLLSALNYRILLSRRFDEWKTVAGVRAAA